MSDQPDTIDPLNPSRGGSTLTTGKVHPDYITRWIPESTTYYVGETRPLKVGVSRADGVDVDPPSSGTISVTQPDGSISAPLTPDLEVNIPASEQVAAQEFTFNMVGTYKAKFLLTFTATNQAVVFEQVLYVSA